MKAGPLGAALYYFGRLLQVIAMWVLLVDIFMAGPMGPQPNPFYIGVVHCRLAARPFASQGVTLPSRSALRRARSFLFARRMAIAMKGAIHLENPVGLPRFLNVILVAPPSAMLSHMYVVSMGNGPSAVLITSFLAGTSSEISYV
jgi:hypothetical protein